MQPIISFIIPMYNTKNYIKNCLMSIKSIEMKKYEIIIIDDGSTDDSVNEVIDIVKDNEQIQLISKKNGGAASARNLGLSKAKGKYICFIDSDDWINSSIFNKTFEEQLLFEDKDIIFFNMVKYFKERDYSKKYIDNDLYRLNEMSGLLVDNISYLNKFPGSSCGKLFRRDFLKKHHILFEEGISNEDIDFMINVVTKTSKYLFINRVLYYYRINRIDSMTNSNSKKIIQDMIFLINKWKKIENESILSILSYEFSTLYFHAGKLDSKESYQLLKENLWLLKQKKCLKNYILLFLSKTIRIPYTCLIVYKILNLRDKK